MAPLRPRRSRSLRFAATGAIVVAALIAAGAFLSRDSASAVAAPDAAPHSLDLAACLEALDGLIVDGTTVNWSAAEANENASIFEGWTTAIDAAAFERLSPSIQLAEERARERCGLRVLLPETDLHGGAHWARLSATSRTPERVVLLVHGLDEPGEIWDDLAPLLRSRGYRVARLDYPNDQAIAKSADLLGASLRALRAAGTRRVDIVGHSMGGLVSRDVLTRGEFYAGDASLRADLPDIERFIMVGTPNKGAPLARLRVALEVREQAMRLLSDGSLVDSLTGFFAKGAGDAGRDLLPGSAFLADLNARPLPRGVTITNIIGVASPLREADVLSMLDSPVARLLLGNDDAAMVADQARTLLGAVGDGVVPRSSALLEGVEDTVEIHANHRSLLRSGFLDAATKRERQEPGAVQVILDRLERAPGQPVDGV